LGKIVNLESNPTQIKVEGAEGREYKLKQDHLTQVFDKKSEVERKIR